MSARHAATVSSIGRGLPLSVWKPARDRLTRKLQACGHTVGIIPAEFVKPYIKSNKNDVIDAEAIAEAATRPSMRFVEIKRWDQVHLLALRHIRDQMVGPGTPVHLPNAILLGIRGADLPRRWRIQQLELPRVLSDEANDLTPAMRQLLSETPRRSPSPRKCAASIQGIYIRPIQRALIGGL
jgi:transposase